MSAATENTNASAGSWDKAKHWMRQNYPKAIGILFVLVAALCYCLAFVVYTKTDVPHQLFSAIGEAFAVAILLLIGGHAYLEYRLAKDAQAQGLVGGVRTALAELFGFLNPRHPPELQAAVLKLASEPIYLDRAKWTLSFDRDPDPDAISITVLIESRGRCVKLDGHPIAARLWVMPSIPGRMSEYRYYSLQCAQSGLSARLRLGQFSADYMEIGADDGCLYLLQDKIIADQSPVKALAFGEWFSFDREACIYRRWSDSLPLLHSNFELQFELELRGNALDDLTISVYQGLGEFWTRSRGDPSIKAWSNVPPGKSTIVSWRRNARTTAQPAAGNAAPPAGIGI